MNTTDRHGSATVTLPSDKEILITRLFDAPARLAFKAYTTPELVKRWWVCDSMQWITCEIDLRVGGRWRYVTQEANGHVVGFHGDYSEIERPRKLVMTEVFEDFPDASADVTVTFDEQDGVTTMKMLVLHEQPEHRDAHLASGMESGMQLSMDRMEEVMSELSL